MRSEESGVTQPYLYLVKAESLFAIDTSAQAKHIKNQICKANKVVKKPGKKQEKKKQSTNNMVSAAKETMGNIEEYDSRRVKITITGNTVTTTNKGTRQHSTTY